MAFSSVIVFIAAIVLCFSVTTTEAQFFGYPWGLGFGGLGYGGLGMMGLGYGGFGGLGYGMWGR
ncbi:hypothetical protein TELCIR_21311 [Teladorsagia circumcincta]|uniref:Neuropeptide-like protein 31 family protein n=1 Tax=Teladorsagia circumcincta TaxID=45464 RepID=A0A2G9TIC2_TELCI|nr:hypothetical protein TELCIR_21311 [Teladorsagia circumcincta]